MKGSDIVGIEAVKSNWKQLQLWTHGLLNDYVVRRHGWLYSRGNLETKD